MKYHRGWESRLFSVRKCVLTGLTNTMKIENNLINKYLFPPGAHIWTTNEKAMMASFATLGNVMGALLTGKVSQRSEVGNKTSSVRGVHCAVCMSVSY
jgi:hypothetical protein